MYRVRRRSGGSGGGGDQITAYRRRERRTRECPWRVRSVILLFKIYIILDGGVCGGGDTRRRGCWWRTRRAVGRSVRAARGASACAARQRAGARECLSVPCTRGITRRVIRVPRYSFVARAFV